MKFPLVLLLLLSLAGNAVLAFFVLRPTTPQSAAAAASPAVASAGVAASAPVADAVKAPPPAAPAYWQTLKPDQSLHTLVANLRASGFPPAVVRAVVSQMISERLDNGAMDHLPFWKRNSNNPEFLAAQLQQSTQRREMLADLLGAEARPSATLDPSTRERRYGQLSDEKVDQLENVTRDYGELRAKLYAERKSGDVPGIMSAQAAVEQEQRADLAAILTPPELEQYEMRSSQSANRLMTNLKNVDVSEAEYTALFRAQKGYDAVDPLRTGGVTTPESMVQRNAAQELLNEQARAILPDDRFYEYLKGSDAIYARTAQFAANYPSVTPAMTYDLTKLDREYQASAMATRAAAGGMPPAERAAQSMAVRKEYQEKVNALLGPDIGKAYSQRNQPGATTQVIRTGGPGGG